MSLLIALAAVCAIVVTPLLARAAIVPLLAKRRRRRAARRTPISRVLEVRRGEVVRVAGVVRPLGSPITLPISHVAGVYHLTELSNTANPGQTDSLRIERFCPLAIDDESGSATVQVHALLDIHAPEEHSGAVERDDASVIAILEARGAEWLGSSPLLWRQHRIAVGDRVTLWGRAELVPSVAHDGRGAEGSYREPPQRLIICPVDGAVVIEAAPRDVARPANT